MSSTESIELRCMGCMRMKEDEGICLFCRFDEDSRISALHHLPPRTILAGKYLVGRVIGEGGFGITYIGWDLNLDIKIAVKEYYPTGFVTRENTVTHTVMPYTGENEGFFLNGREKFVNEAKSLAKFYALPGIVSVKDFFLENGTAYIVMEFVEGETLKAHMERIGGKLPAQQVFEMMKPLMRSLSEVHRAGIIHRDISPDNIMITKEENVKLLDFGAARDFAGSANRSMSVLLKPGYAPEEQYRSHGVQGPWTDVYALAATIYRAVTGVTPDESNERLLKDEVKPPSRLGVSISPRQEYALMKGMAVLQKDRYQNVEELSTALYTETSEQAGPRPISCGSVQFPVPAIKSETIQAPHLPKFNKFILIITLLTAALAIVFYINITNYDTAEYWHSEYQKQGAGLNQKMTQLQNSYNVLNDDYARLQNSNDALNADLKKARNNNVQLQADMAEYYDAWDFLENNIAIVIEGDESVYHKYGCSEIPEDYMFWAYNVEAAKGRGHDPCPVCH